MKNGSKTDLADLKFGDLRVSWLETFAGVSRLQNRTAVAKELGITQGAVTKHIHSLERWSRMPLVYTDSVPAKLTEQGEAFAEVAEGVLEALAEARASLVVSPPEPKARISAKDLRVPPSVPRPTMD